MQKRNPTSPAEVVNGPLPQELKFCQIDECRQALVQRPASHRHGGDGVRANGADAGTAQLVFTEKNVRFIRRD